MFNLRPERARLTMLERETPIERFEVFASGLDHPECIAFVYGLDPTSNGDLERCEVYVEAVGRLPDGLAVDLAGNPYITCSASDDIRRNAPSRRQTLLAWDHHASLISRPANLAWGGAGCDMPNVTSVCRTTIARERLTSVHGKRFASQT